MLQHTYFSHLSPEGPHIQIEAGAPQHYQMSHSHNPDNKIRFTILNFISRYYETLDIITASYRTVLKKVNMLS